MLRNLKRNFGYVFWTFAEQASVIAIPRLVLWPLAAYVIGKEDFGVFVFAFAITSILGIQPANGLATAILRHLSDYNKEQQQQFCGIAMRLCHRAMIIVLLAGLLCCVIVAGTRLQSSQVVYCLIPLILSLYPENQTHLLLTESRFHRRFRKRAFWFGIRSIIIVIAGYLGAELAGLIGLAWGYSIGHFLIYGFLRYQYREWLKTASDLEMVFVLKKVWLHITVAGVIAFAGPYLNRIILGGLHGFTETADLVAATSVAFIFLAPITSISGLLLSVISRYESINDFSLQARWQWLCMLILGMVVCPLTLKYFSSSIIHFLYPGFGDKSVELLKILIWMIMASTVVNLCRPFVMKFGSVRVVPLINIISLAATLGSALVLIPIYKTTGAAWAIVSGSIVTAALWFLYASRIYILSKKV